MIMIVLDMVENNENNNIKIPEKPSSKKNLFKIN